jgi:predicted permease
MWRLRILASRLRGLFAGRSHDRELNTEIADHLRLLTERFVGQGLSPGDAAHAARLQFGGIAQLQEEYRDTRGIPLLENLRRDFAFSLRMIRRRPGFSLTVIAILALGLGANTAIFSLVNGVLLRPLPFAHPERLVALFERDILDNGDRYDSVAPAHYLDWQKQTTTLDSVAAINYTRLNLSGATESAAPERIDACASSANLFETLGVMPILGRAFTPEEDRPGAPPVVVIGYALWKRRFNASPDVLFSVIKLDSRMYTVVGVMPPGFSYPSRSNQAWIPLQTWLLPAVLQAHDNHVLTVIGRLRAGVTVAQATAEIGGMARRYKNEHPKEVVGKGADVMSLREMEVQGARKLLLLLFGAVSCVLLIACVNVANLLLSRAAGRKREVAIRVALGAARGRIVRQLLMESTLLSLLGGLAGLLLASQLTAYLAAWGAAWLPQSAAVRLDPAVFLFSLSVALGAGVLAGLFPALQTSSSFDVARDLKESVRANTGGRSQDRFRELLVVAEVALSLVLLLGAGLLIRSFAHLATTDLGLRTAGRLTMRVSLPDARYHERSQVSAFLKEVTSRLQSIPGVTEVGLSSCPPVTLPGYCPDSVFQIEPRPSTPDRPMDAKYLGVDPGFFRAAGIPILRGRSLTLSDGIGVDDKHPIPGAVVINQALARKFFPSEDPVGKFLALDWFVGNNTERSALRYRVVGVSGDVLERPQAPAQPTFYLPLLDGDSTDLVIILHTAIDPGSVAGGARSAVRRVDPDLAVFGIRSMEESVNQTTRDQQFVMTLLAAFAGIAMVLAAVGLYGVVSWGVSQRVKEIAIRIALGATGREVHRMVLLKGLRPALLGIAIGIPAAASLTGLMQGFLFGVRPIDPLTFTVVPLLLLGITVLACSVPAVRATRVDPTIGLRVD